MIKSSYKIFYTDDDKDDHELFAEIVTSINPDHEIFFQSHGGELMQLLEAEEVKPDIIFLDLNMPHKNGFQVLEEISQSEKLAGSPIFIFSTSNIAETKDLCRQLGATGYICKPASYQEMKSTLEEVLTLNWKNPGTSQNHFLF